VSDSTEPSLTRSQAVEKVLAQIHGPITVDEVCERVLTIWPSKAKNPLSAMRSHLRQDHSGKALIFLDAKTILPLPIAMRGVRFRIPLSRREANRGALIILPAFEYFLRRELDPAAVQLLDQKGQPLPARVITIREQANTPFGKQTIEHAAFDLGGWFRAQRVRRDDSILVTIEDWTNGAFRLEHEPAKRHHKKEIEGQDRELADLLFGMLEESSREVIYAYVAVPTAYARLSDPRRYPGSHWIEVVGRDPRMRYDGWAIRYSDWRSPLEQMLYEEEPVPQAAFSPTQGRQVYRFKAALWHRPGLWRTVEIQGEQALAEFDAILRDAFEHDAFDHLGGFWKLVRRGKGKRFREVDVGDVDPFGEGSGAEAHIAGLGLKPGDELKYVYDFGDWIEHRITLEGIVEPEKGVKYPRIVARNKPRYRNCQTCRDQGRESRATWVCIECSNRQQREVLLCEDCLDREHEEHYAEEILY
jgi:hypothetical protein